MKIFKMIVLITVLFFGTVGLADDFNYYWLASESIVVKLKDDTTFAPVGNKVQGISANNFGNIQPPSTNSSNYYLDSFNVKTTSPNSTNMFIGTDFVYGQPIGPGECLGKISRDGTNGVGWMRIFSSNTVPNSAFYMDGDYTSLTFAGGNTNSGSKTINNVNPAFIIPFSVTSPKNYQVGKSWMENLAVTGICSGTSSTSDNNKLVDTTVSVKWENITFVPPTNGWITISDNNWFGSIVISNGQPAIVTNTITFQIIGASARSGFPISSVIAQNYINVPEPITCVIIVFVSLLFLRNK